jgi:hypothetical protein
MSQQSLKARQGGSERALRLPGGVGTTLLATQAVGQIGKADSFKEL